MMNRLRSWRLRPGERANVDARDAENPPREAQKVSAEVSVITQAEDQAESDHGGVVVVEPYEVCATWNDVRSLRFNKRGSTGADAL